MMNRDFVLKVLIVLSLAGLFLSKGAVWAQNSEVQWRNSFGGISGDQFNSVVDIPNGGFVAVGNSYQTSFGNGDWIGINYKGGYDAIIVRYDAEGFVVWKANFGGSGSDFFNSVVAVSDGGFLAVGSSGGSSFGNGDWTGISSKGNSDAIIVKFDASGNVLWKKSFGGGYDDSFSSVTNLTVGNGFAVVGNSVISTSANSGDWTGIIGNGSNDSTIIKYSSSGDIVWKKNFGGSNQDNFTSVKSTSDYGYISVGYSAGGSFGNGSWSGFSSKGGLFDAVIVKYAANGNVLWKKNFGGNYWDYFLSITNAQDGGFVTVGYSGWESFGNGDWTGYLSKAVENAIIVKYDSNGNIQWKRNIGGGNSDFEIFNSVTTATDGGFVALGYSNFMPPFGGGDWTGFLSKGSQDNTEAIIVKYDEDGNVQWKTNFGGDCHDYLNSITTAPNGGFVAVGYSDISQFSGGDWAGINGNGTDDATIAKIIPVDISGYINLQKFKGNKATITGTIEISNSLSGVVIESHPIIFDSIGNYSVETILKGNYTISVKCSHWLSKSKPISLNGGASSIDFCLVNGDVTSDNAVDESDLGTLGDSWYLSLGNVGFNAAADLNGDGVVDESDLGILGD